jgi:hypothetical protein
MRFEEKYGLKKLLFKPAEILKKRISKGSLLVSRLTGNRMVNNKKMNTISKILVF